MIGLKVRPFVIALTIIFFFCAQLLAQKTDSSSKKPVIDTLKFKSGNDDSKKNQSKKTDSADKGKSSGKQHGSNTNAKKGTTTPDNEGQKNTSEEKNKKKHDSTNQSRAIDTLQGIIGLKNKTIARLQSEIKTCLETQPDQNYFSQFVIVSVVAVIFLLALSAGLFLNHRKNEETKTLSSDNGNLKSKNNSLSSANKELAVTNEDLRIEYTKLEENFDKLLKVHKELLEETENFSPLPAQAETPKKYFFGEAMVTAGPRKNFDKDPKDGDYGLGEDVVGFIIQDDKAFFWVLDGTSDSDKLTKPLLTADGKEEEYFSSRLLAQSIGWNLQQLIDEKLPQEFSAKQLLQQAIKKTETEWKNKIEQFADTNYTALSTTLKDKDNVLLCSTTAVFGVLHLSGELDICRIGDTKIIAYPSDNNFSKSTGRQFATLLKDDDDHIKLSFNDFTDVRSQHIELSNIRTLLVMTDGISNQMEKWLKDREDLNFDRNTRELFARFKQKTLDDKALCIIQIKE